MSGQKNHISNAQFERKMPGRNCSRNQIKPGETKEAYSKYMYIKYCLLTKFLTFIFSVLIEAIKVLFTKTCPGLFGKGNVNHENDSSGESGLTDQHGQLQPTSKRTNVKKGSGMPLPTYKNEPYIKLKFDVRCKFGRLQQLESLISEKINNEAATHGYLRFLSNARIDCTYSRYSRDLNPSLFCYHLANCKFQTFIMDASFERNGLTMLSGPFFDKSTDCSYIAFLDISINYVKLPRQHLSTFEPEVNNVKVNNHDVSSWLNITVTKVQYSSQQSTKLITESSPVVHYYVDLTKSPRGEVLDKDLIRMLIELSMEDMEKKSTSMKVSVGVLMPLHNFDPVQEHNFDLFRQLRQRNTSLQSTYDDLQYISVLAVTFIKCVNHFEIAE